jgi:Domain of unknown function in PX-proteins (DUF3818)
MGTHIVRSRLSLFVLQFYSDHVQCLGFASFICRLASTIFHHFIAADSASESFASLKRIHGLMPYFVLKGILKVSNPVSMIRGVDIIVLSVHELTLSSGVLDLFLAQPFGGRSLLQR